MTKKRRTLAYTPLGIRPFSHHGPPDPDSNLFLSLDVSPPAGAANVDTVAVAITTEPTTTGGRNKRRRGYARTVSQKKEARRARRLRGATMIMGGDSLARHRRRPHEDEDDDEVLEEADDENGRDRDGAVIGGRKEENLRVNTEDDDDDNVDYDENDAKGLEKTIDNMDVFDFSLEGDAATNDDVVEVARDDESSAQGESWTPNMSRSSSTNKRRVILDDDDDESSREEEEEERSAESILSGRVDKTITKNALDRGIFSFNVGMKDERDDGDSTRYRRSKRLGMTPIATTTGSDHSSADEYSERKFMVDSMTSVGKRNFSTCTSDKKGGRRKLLQTKIGEVEHVENESFNIEDSSHVDGSAPRKAPKNVPSTLAKGGGHIKVGGANADAANADAVDRASHLSTKIKTVAPFRKRSSRVSHWVEMAQVKLAACEAAESSSMIAIGGRNSKDFSTETANCNKKEEGNFEEDSTLVDGEVSIDDDEPSEYQPTQDGDKESVVIKRSPRLFRSSSRIGKGMKYKGVQEAPTKVVAPRKRTKNRHTKNTRGSDVESSINCDDRIDPTKGRREKSKSSGIKYNGMEKKKKFIDFEDDAFGGRICSKSQSDTTLRPNQQKSSKVSEVEQNPHSPYGTKCALQMDKSLKSSNGKGEKLLQLGINVPSDSEKEKVTNHNDNNMEFVGLKVEYHVEEDDKDKNGMSVSGDNRSILFTQAITQGNTSQYMQQSMDSSTANSKGGLFGPIAENSGHEASLNKLKSIEMNTRNISDMGSNISVNSTSIDHAEFNECAAQFIAKNVRIKSYPEDLVTSCVELTTRGIFNSDPASLRAIIQTQSHSQQSSVVSAETGASMAMKAMDGESCKLTSQELAKALKIIGFHIAEAGKMMKKVIRSGEVDYL